MPYALLAGVIFIGIDLAANSIIPSVILHFLNNLLSLVWICYCEDTVARSVFLIALGLLAALSVSAVVVFRRGRLLDSVKMLKKNEGSTVELGSGPVAVLAVCLLSALLMLVG